MRTIPTAALLLACTMSMAGCPPVQQPAAASAQTAGDDPAAEKAFKRARQVFEQGLLEEADGMFEVFLAAHGDDPRAAEATVYRARVALSAKDQESALALLKGLTFDRPEDPVARQAELYLSRALFLAGRYGEALGHMTALMGRLTATEDRALLLDMAWRSAMEVGEIERAVGWLDARLEISSGQPEEGLAGDLERLVMKVEEISVLERLADNLNAGGAAWPLVMSRLAWKLYEAERYDEASGTLEAMRDAGLPQTVSTRELEVLLRKRTRVDLGSVGCILPLSGRSRLVGEAILRGVMIGSKQIRFGRDGHPISVVIKDSQGDPVKASRAVEELVNQDNVAALLGPADGRVAASVARTAQSLSVPVVLLSAVEGVEDAGDFVFSDFITSGAEVKALVDAALRLGRGEFAALYPADGYGKRLVKELDMELERRGVKPAKKVRYKPGQKTFSKEVEELAKLEFDALFLPDSSERLALIAPALAVEGIWSAPAGEEPEGEDARGVQLLIPSTGSGDALARRAGRYLQGAVFATGFHRFATSEAEEFSRSFEDEYGALPTLYSAFGHDAVVLVARAIRDGAMGRAEIAGALRGTEPGEDGMDLVAPFGGFEGDGAPRDPVVLLVLVGDALEVLR